MSKEMIKSPWRENSQKRYGESERMLAGNLRRKERERERERGREREGERER
jgi:hypothetical protein